MSTTKYIVDNVSGQTIPEINLTIINADTILANNYLNLPTPNSISSGPSAPGSAVVANDTDVDINFSDGVGTAWSFSTTGMTFPDDTVQSTAYGPKYKVYTALLTQSGGDAPTNFGDDSQQPFVIGATYMIAQNDDNGDFTNIGAPNNNVGTYFVATGTTPASWGNNIGNGGVNVNYNSGAPVVTVLENTIGNIWFTFSSNGIYLVNSNELFIQNKTALIFGGANYNTTLDTTTGYGPAHIGYNNYPNSFGIECIKTQGDERVNDVLNNTFIEIRVYN